MFGRGKDKELKRSREISRLVETIRGCVGDEAKADKIWDAACALGDLGDTAAVEPLISILEDLSNPSWWNHYEPGSPLRSLARTEVAAERMPIIIALGDLKDTRSVASLIGMLEAGSPAEPDEVERAAAATALGEIGDERAADALAAALNNEDEMVRFKSALALDRLGDFRAVSGVAEFGLSSMEFGVDPDFFADTSTQLDRWRRQEKAEQTRSWEIFKQLGPAESIPILEEVAERCDPERANYVYALIADLREIATTRPSD